MIGPGRPAGYSRSSVLLSSRVQSGALPGTVLDDPSPPALACYSVGGQSVRFDHQRPESGTGKVFNTKNVTGNARVAFCGSHYRDCRALPSHRAMNRDATSSVAEKIAELTE